MAKGRLYLDYLIFSVALSSVMCLIRSVFVLFWFWFLTNWFLLSSSLSYSFSFLSLSVLGETISSGTHLLQYCGCIIIFFLIKIPCGILSTAVSGAVDRIRVSKGVLFCIKKRTGG